MEELENALFLDQVPAVWTERAYPSLLGLTSWFVDLLMRLRELETWSTDFVVKFKYFLHHIQQLYNMFVFFDAGDKFLLCIYLYSCRRVFG